MSWLWQNNPDYDETVRVAKEGLEKGGAFGRFTGRTKKTYTWSEHIVKNWLDAHGIKYIIIPFTSIHELVFHVELRR